MHAGSLEEFSRLVGGIYDASLDRARWEPLLKEVAHFVGGTGAILYSHDLTANEVTWASFVGMDPDGIRAYEQYYSKIDARYAPAMALPTGSVLTEGTIMEKRALMKTEFYQDFLRRYDIPHIAASILSTDPEFVAISIQGTRQRGPFGAIELERLQLLVPHLARAVRISNRIGGYRNSIDSLHQLLDSVTVGIIAFDCDGCISEFNAAGRQALERHDAFFCHRRELRACTGAADKMLRRIIATAISPIGEESDATGSVVVPRMDGRKGYTAIASRVLRSSPLAMNDRVVAFLVLIDHEAQPAKLPEILRNAFRLSPAESAIAELLFGGRSLREIAHLRSTTIETTRKQLKNLLYKCQAKNQSQLMRIFAELAQVRIMLPAAKDHHLPR